MLGVTGHEGDEVCDAGGSGTRDRLPDILSAEIDADYFAAEFLSEEEGAFTFAAGHIEDAEAGTQVKVFAETCGETLSTGVKGIAEEEPGEVTLV
jgi:hypothetical protein